MKIEERLLDKYNVPVPRYTSYPPANHFDEAVTPEKYNDLIIKSNSWEPKHIAFYIHIPFCKKICFYCGCNACTIKQPGEVEAYLGALKKEIIATTAQISKDRVVTQVHFGGGTPNSIPAAMIAEILALLKADFKFAGDAEIAIETNPAYLDMPYLDALLEAGFNRFSFGIQDLNEQVLKHVNRQPSALPVKDLIGHVRSENSGAGINLDFIYGLPGQTVESFSDTIKKAADMDADRLVTFSYAHVPWIKKHQQILEKKGIPGAKEKTDMFLDAYGILTASGYEPIGLDHFVKSEDELFRAFRNDQLHRNFQGYCAREKTGQVYAFGVSAISQLENAYLQHTRDLHSYISDLDNGKIPVRKGISVSNEQVIIREVITRLMCNKRIDWNEISGNMDVSPGKLKKIVQYDHEQLEELRADGLIGFSDEEITVTETGSMFIRNIAAALDPAYRKQVNKYSKSI